MNDSYGRTLRSRLFLFDFIRRFFNRQQAMRRIMRITMIIIFDMMIMLMIIGVKYRFLISEKFD